jgi:serine/threonine protein kinase
MELGDLIADKYRLERFLGEGGMGTVFAAINVVTGKPVAIKCLHADLTENEEYPARFLREAQVAGRIDHPNVVNVFDVGRHGSALFLVMELLQGETLAARMARGPQDPTGFIQLMLPALRGVHAAHRIGVTHRDLKPDNIFLCRGPDGESREAKVLDFGISKIGEELAGGRKQLTLEGAIFGTPQYMAPEQIRSARSADARSDVYALGVIFYRAFSGEFPFDSETLPGLALRIVEGNPVPIQELCPELEPELAEAVMRSLALDPKERFPTVAAFGEALEPFADGFTFVTSPGTWESFEGERPTNDGSMRTPGLRRPNTARTPSSHSRQRTPISRAGHQPQIDRSSAASPTPAGQTWKRARGPAIGLALLLFALGGGLVWTMMQPSARPVAEQRAAPPSIPAAALPAPAPEPIVAAREPIAPTLPTALPPSAEPDAAPEASPEAPSTEAPEQKLTADEPANETPRERARVRRSKDTSRASAAAQPAPVATPVEPAPAAPARVEPPPSRPEPAQPSVRDPDGNPYLRH